MENRLPFQINHIDPKQDDKRIKGMILKGPHPLSIPETWIEFRGKIFVIYYTPGIVENSNLFAFDLAGNFLWRAPGSQGSELSNEYCEFTWNERLQRMGSRLWGGGAAILDEDSGQIVELFSGK